MRIAGRAEERSEIDTGGLAMELQLLVTDVDDTHTWSEADVVNATEHLLMDLDHMKGARLLRMIVNYCTDSIIPFLC